MDRKVVVQPDEAALRRHDRLGDGEVGGSLLAAGLDSDGDWEGR